MGSEWLAIGLVPVLGAIMLSFSAWAEGRLAESGLAEEDIPES
jgi:hypothetical protein